VNLFEVVKDFTKYVAENKKIEDIKNVVSNPWFLQLAWMNKGELRMNPIDSKPKEFVITYSREAQDRANIFNQYIDKLLEKYQQSDTVGNVDKFKAILALRNTGGQLYKPFNFKDLSAAVVGKPYKEIKPDSLLLNTIPVNSLKCVNRKKHFFADRVSNKVPQTLKKPLIIEDSVIMYLQNVSKTEKAYVDTNTTLINDRSKFQEGLDQVAEDAANLGAIALSLSQYTGLLPQYIFKPNNTISQSPSLEVGPNTQGPIDFENGNESIKQELIQKA
jgi:hypothetical protein